MYKCFLILLFAFLGTLIFKSQIELNKDTNVPALVPPKGTEHISMGYNETIADILWLRLIQDMDSCDGRPVKYQPDSKKKAKEKPSGSSERFETAADPIQFLISQKHEPARCNLGWSYQMTDRIVDLAPRFRIPYVIGGTALSVLAEDRDGAARIFDRGVRQYPDDWSLAYRAAYHYLFEMGNASRAAELLVQAGKNGAPQWVFSLAANLYSREGRIFFARKILVDALKESPNGPNADRIKKRLNEMDAMLEGHPQFK